MTQINISVANDVALKKQGLRLSNSLVVVPSLRAHVEGPTVGLTHKFISGIQQFAERWPGPVRVLMQSTHKQSDDLDLVVQPKADLPFELTVASFNSLATQAVLSKASVVQLSLDCHQTHLSLLCRRLNVPCAFVSEYRIKTRFQIAQTEVRGLRLAVAMRGNLIKKRNFAARLLMPTQFNAMASQLIARTPSLTPSPLLFFDTRTRLNHMATEAFIRRRSKVRRTSGVLRLAFSGRLIAMKGVDHLPMVAHHLRVLGRPFRLTICGAGAYETATREAVARYD